jgi:pyruvate/2-oxoglutarate dehydrogenase complex dihydrolipoamide dehydrogenase (E3) component
MGSLHKRAVIVGGGLIGVELANASFEDIAVTFLVREPSFGVVYCLLASQMINRHILEHHIDLRLETNLVEITLKMVM